MSMSGIRSLNQSPVGGNEPVTEETSNVRKIHGFSASFDPEHQVYGGLS